MSGALARAKPDCPIVDLDLLDPFILGVASGDYEMAAVASDVFDRMITRGTVKREDFRIVYRSANFPTSSFAHAHDLRPELASKL